MEQKKDIGFLLKVINKTLRTNANAHLKQYDMTLAQTRVLRLLKDAGGPMQLKQLEQYFEVKHPTMLGILRRMEMKNLIRITVNKQDKRSRDVTLLSKGEALCTHLRDHIRLNEAQLVNGFAPEEVELLRSMLERVQKNVEQLNELQHSDETV